MGPGGSLWSLLTCIVLNPDVSVDDPPIDGVVEVDHLELYAKENAANHRTGQYELVSDKSTPVLRRADNFYLAVVTKDKEIDLNHDVVRVVFEFGKYQAIRIRIKEN